MRLKGILGGLVTAGVLLCSLPATAHAQAAAEDAPVVAAQYALLHFGGYGSNVGFDVSYASAPMTEPATGLGIRAGFVGELGIHHFDGGSLKLFQGGVNMTSTKVGSPKYRPYARVMFGVGSFPGDSDFVMSLMPGLDIALEGRPFKLRVEAGQVWDFYDGGPDVAWRYSIGISTSLK